MRELRIVGAGMAGLLAARMLARHRPIVLERQDDLPHNHSAVLRFGSSAVADVLGIPFKKVQLIKTTIPWRNPVADAMAYSKKVLGEYRSDRSVVLPDRWSTTERWIAPPDLIEQMADGVEVCFKVDYDFAEGKPKVISTIPMPSLARKLGYRDLGWQVVGGKNLTANLKNCEAYCSVVVPDPAIPFYRASITGWRVIVEATGDDAARMSADPESIVLRACDLLGVEANFFYDVEVHDSPYAKIIPIDEGERQMFIHWASTQMGRAWQLGRFATWRPKLLLDDLVHDVRVIERWMTMTNSGYEQDLKVR